MNYAISSPSVITAINSTGSSAALTTALISAFLDGGWTVHASISGGQTLQGLSPQGYLVWIDIWASNSTTCSLQLHSAVGSGCVGYAHQLHWDATFSWQVITHPCGFFISQPAISSAVQGSACMGGIPMVAANCGLAAALGAVTEVWFSFGDYIGNPFFFGRSPRSNIDVGTGDSLGGTTGLGSVTACWDGVMAAPTVDWDTPEILRFSPQTPDDVGGSLANDSHPLFYGEGPMNYPASVAWNDGTLQPIKVRGQIYNAVVSSASYARNSSAAFDGYGWISYTDSYYWGTLLALSGGAAGVGNLQF